jgi:hypothetical protein
VLAITPRYGEPPWPARVEYGVGRWKDGAAPETPWSMGGLGMREPGDGAGTTGRGPVPARAYGGVRRRRRGVVVAIELWSVARRRSATHTQRSTV